MSRTGLHPRTRARCRCSRRARPNRGRGGCGRSSRCARPRMGTRRPRCRHRSAVTRWPPTSPVRQPFVAGRPASTKGSTGHWSRASDPRPLTSSAPRSGRTAAAWTGPGTRSWAARSSSSCCRARPRRISPLAGIRGRWPSGTLRPGPAVAETDEELIDFLGFLASRSEVNARPFSEAQPRLHMRLDGGARLAATAWVTPRPAVVIRRHRLREVTLAELAGLGLLSDVAVSFLRAAVRAKKSIVVAGPQGAGKTTLVRGLCAELDPWERIGTFETEYELHLHELPEKHRRVVAWESRPGSGEVGLGGRQAGEITLDDLLIDS